MCSCKMDSAAWPLVRLETPTDGALPESSVGEAAFRDRVVAGFSLDPVALRFLEDKEETADAGFVLLVELFVGLAFEAVAVFSLVDSCSFGIRNMRF